MLPKNLRRLLYVSILLLFSAIGTTAIANNEVHSIFDEVTSVLKEVVSVTDSNTATAYTEATETAFNKRASAKVASSAMFATIIQGADDEEDCSIDGRTVARFILCGDADDRTISLSGGPYSSVSWQRLTGATPNTNDECPDLTSAYTEVATTQVFDLDASTVDASEGAEYRVQINGGAYFYIEVVKSSITQTFTKKNFVCNNPGEIEITGLPNNYQFRIREGSGAYSPYQSSSRFTNLNPGSYTVQTRLNIAGSVCEYVYETIVIEQVDIAIAVTFTNPICSGENGTITATVNPSVPGPYVYTLLDENGAEIEFTSTISSNTYTFGAVSEGIYAVQVETNDCKEDIPNGIAAPIQFEDTSGNPIEIGNGLDPISVITDTNGMSFGCSTISSVNIDVTPSGGSGTYSYTVTGGGSGDSGGFFTGTSVYSVPSPGTYTFFVTDDLGCTAEKSEYVAELDSPEITASDVIGTCTNGGGKVRFDIIDAKGFNLEFRATNNTADPFTSSSTIPVADGTYNTIEVRYSQDGFTCTLSLPSVTVTSDGGLSGSASLTQDYTCNNGEGIIEFAPASGGSGIGYEYSLDNINYQSGTTFSGLTPGTTYTPWIRDDAGCYLELAAIAVSEPIAPTSISFTQDNLDCATGTVDVTIDVLPSGYVISQYQVVSSNPVTVLPPAQTNNVFSGLQLDTSYQFELTNANGCTYPASYTTGGVSSIRARVKSGGDRSVCPGATDGNGAFLVDGFATDYDYVVLLLPATPIDSGTNSSDLEIPITNLGAGTYEITVTDNDTNCTSTVSFDVEEAATPLSVTPNVTAMSCQNSNIGRVQATATGGFGGYRYQLQWPTPSTVQGPKSGRTFGDLTEEGTYTLTVIDSEGCTASTTFDLTAVTAPDITFDSADYCYSATNASEITVTSTAGSAALSTHQYRINGGALQTPTTPGTYTFDNLVPGNYTIEVVDGNSCTDQTTTITIPPQLLVQLDLNQEIACGGNGEMQITVSGGDITDLTSTAYTIFRDGAAVAGQTGNQLPSASFTYTMSFTEFGDYTVSVTDNNGCSNTSEPLTFAEPTNIAATHRIVGPSCGDANSGFVEITPTVSSGVPPFEVVFAPVNELRANPLDPNAVPDSTPSTTYSFSSQTIYSGLAAGDYEYVVKDSRNCVTTVIPVTVTEDTSPSPDATITPIDATCSTTGSISGGVIVDLTTAGSPDYTVTIEDNFGNALVTQNNVAQGDFPLTIEDPSLEPGDYQVIVLDSRGCRDIEGLTISTATLDIVPDFDPAPTCDPAGTTLCVDLTGGTTPLNYSVRLVEVPANLFETANGAPADPSRHCFTGLLNGVSYTVEVRDDNTGCTYEEIVTLPDGPGPTVTLTIDNATCRNGDVGINYNIASGLAPYDIIITNLDTGVIEYDVTGSSSTSLATDLTVPAGRYGVSVRDANDCSGGARAESTLNLPRVDIIDNQNANCNEMGQLTVRGSGGNPFTTGSPYLYAYVPAGTPVDDDGTLTPGDASDDFSDASTVSLPGSLAPGTDYDIWVKDANDCAYKITAAVIQLNPDLPLIDPVVDNQCDVTATAAAGFDITLSLPGDYDTPTFTLNGVSQTIANSGDATVNTTATFTVNSVGSYPYNIIDANGCDIDGIAEVYQVLSASGNFTTEPTCEEFDGVVTVVADGGSGNFTYTLSGTDYTGATFGPILDADNDGIFPGIPPGNYEVTVEDQVVADGAGNCSFLVDNIVRSRPTQPAISDTGESDVSCNGLADGSISVSLVGGTDVDGIQEYNLYASTLATMPAILDTSSRIRSNNSGSFLNLAPDTYVIEVVTDRNCFDRAEVTIVEQPPFEIDATTGTLVCNPEANQFSTTTVSATIVGSNVGNGAPYGYKIDLADSYQTSPDFEITDTGADQVITIYAIDANGCEFNDSVTVLAPNEVTATITQVRAMDCENPEQIRIEVVGSTNFIIEDQGFSVSPVTSASQPSGSSIIIDLPMVAGEYRLQVNDVGGCTYPIAPYEVLEPVLPTVTISENKSVVCLGDTEGILDLNMTDFDPAGIYDYVVYYATDPGFSGGTFGTPVPGNSTGTINIATDGNPTTIIGLGAGNLRVVINEQGKTAAGCNVFSNVTAIQTPNLQLRITSLEEIGRVGCNDDLGEILATTEGGYDDSPYEYMLEYFDGTDFVASTNVNYATFEDNGGNNQFKGLSAGNYRVTVRDIEGCTHFAEIELLPVPVVEAEAIITTELECPQGSDAVIVAVEPGTMTPGAIGGVPGGGYQYRLIQLDPDNLDPTDESSYIRDTGLQNDPEFEGDGGMGVISAGWYTIEVISSLDCQAFTEPIEVVAPPSIAPALIQTSVPACGNIAEMMIRVNNPQGGTYEYRRIYPVGDPLYTDPSVIPWEPVDETDANGLPVKTQIPGNIGESYRFEVRKIGSSSTCTSRKTNGITITDAEPLVLEPTSPTFDVSCAFEVDGRIEAIATGGTGIYEFRIYDFDPGTDAFIALSLPTYNNRAMQDFGTFENLNAGDYWISVISRQNCGVVQGPFSIAPAEPVIIADSATPTTCTGEADGTITMNVTSGTSGLVKFAIEPSLSEFFTDPDNPTTYTFTDLEGDRTYIVLAQDAEGCPQTFEVYVGEPDELVVTGVDTTPETCIMAADGTASLTISGGTPFIDRTDPSNPIEYYQTKLIGPGSDGTEVFLRNDDLYFSNLAGGVSYIVFVQDANMCDTFVEVPIEIGVDLTAEPIVAYGCEGIFPNNTARVELQDDSRISEILFALDPVDETDAVTAQATDVRSWGDLPAGDHIVYVYHENGCTNTVEFTIDAYEVLTLDAQKTGPNELTAIASGGFGGYEYFFNGESNGSEGIYTTTESEIVEIRVVDQNGCVAVASIPFEFTGMLELPNFFTPNGDNENDFWAPGNRQFFPDIEVIIYDRYGRVVARLNQVSQWDGLYDGKEVPSGDYWYVVNQNDKTATRYVGHFTLYR